MLFDATDIKLYSQDTVVEDVNMKLNLKLHSGESKIYILGNLDDNLKPKVIQKDKFVKTIKPDFTFDLYKIENKEEILVRESTELIPVEKLLKDFSGTVLYKSKFKNIDNSVI